MPYVKSDQREFVKEELDALIKKARSGAVAGGMKGLANYLVTRLVLGLLEPNNGYGWHYGDLADVIGTLEAAKLEVYRRLVAPYEDGTIERNGDLDEYKS